MTGPKLLRFHFLAMLLYLLSLRGLLFRGEEGHKHLDTTQRTRYQEFVVTILCFKNYEFMKYRKECSPEGPLIDSLKLRQKDMPSLDSQQFYTLRHGLSTDLPTRQKKQLPLSAKVLSSTFCHNVGPEMFPENFQVVVFSFRSIDFQNSQVSMKCLPCNFKGLQFSVTGQSSYAKDNHNEIWPKIQINTYSRQLDSYYRSLYNQHRDSAAVMTREIDTLEELRLIEELGLLDHKLLSKKHNHHHPDSHERIPCPRKPPSQAHYQRAYQPKTQIINNQMEYLSEINDQHFDDDSLFAHPTHFIHSLENKQALEEPWIEKSIEKSNKNDQANGKSNLMHQSKSYQKFAIPHKSDHISKEKHYAYKKQQQVHHSPINRPLGRKSISVHQDINKPKKEKHSEVQMKSSVYPKCPRPEKRGNTPTEPNEHITTKTQQQFGNFETLEEYFQRIIGESRQSQQKSKSKTRRIETDSNSLQCTFKPTILKKSERMVKNNKGVVERLYTHNISKEEKKPYQSSKNKTSTNKQRIEQLSQPRQIKPPLADRPEETHSFRPSLSKKSLEQMSNCTYDVATRNALWLQEKNQKIQRLKRQEEEQRKRKEGCTHTPTICEYRGETDANFSRFGKIGIANYFDRVSMARKKQLPRQEQPLRNKQNRHLVSNVDPLNSQISKGKKQSYQDAVRQLHNKILSLKI